MNKLANLNMRHWSERMSPNFGMSNRPPNMPGPGMNNMPKLAHNGSANVSATSLNQAGMVMSGPIFYSFNIPLSSDLAGPDTEDILHATTDAVLRWTHNGDAPDDIPVYKLLVHAENFAKLENICKRLAANMDIETATKSHILKNGKTQVTTVCLVGAPDSVYRARETILNEMPLALVRTLTSFSFLSISLFICCPFVVVPCC